MTTEDEIDRHCIGYADGLARRPMQPADGNDDPPRFTGKDLVTAFELGRNVHYATVPAAPNPTLEAPKASTSGIDFEVVDAALRVQARLNGLRTLRRRHLHVVGDDG